MSILVTGGGGFLGRCIVEQLVARGEQVRVFSRGAYPDLAQLGVDIRRGDITDAAAVLSAVDGVDGVFHAAALPGIWGAWSKFYQINTQGTQHVIEACHKSGVRRLVYTSSPSVVYDGHPHLAAEESLPYPKKWLCHYPHSKALAEQAVLQANGSGGLLTVALRPHLIWGPRDNHLIPRLIQRAKSGRLAQIGDGQNVVSMSYVENAATAHLQAFDELGSAARCAGRAYFINEIEPVPLWNWVNDILALVGLPPVQRKISVRTARFVGTVLEGVYTIFRFSGEPPMTRFLASQLSQSHSYSTKRAQSDFGYVPKVSYEEGLMRLGDWLHDVQQRSR